MAGVGLRRLRTYREASASGLSLRDLQKVRKALLHVKRRDPIHAAEHAGTEFTDRGEFIQAVQPYVERDAYTHGKAGNGPVLAVCQRAEILVHVLLMPSSERERSLECSGRWRDGLPVSHTSFGFATRILPTAQNNDKAADQCRR